MSHRDLALVQVLARNSLVLALHAFACVAGFIAGSELPGQVDRHRGLWRRVHTLSPSRCSRWPR